MDLGEVARCIRADSMLCNRVTEAARKEFHWTCSRVEDAIVLLGGERICALLSPTVRRHHSFAKLGRSLRGNRVACFPKPLLLETIQEVQR